MVHIKKIFKNKTKHSCQKLKSNQASRSNYQFTGHSRDSVTFKKKKEIRVTDNNKATTDLFSILIVLPFLQCHILGADCFHLAKGI